MGGSRLGDGDRGDSLIEILVALAVLGIGITALLGGLGTAATTTVTNRGQSQASTTLLAAAEHVKSVPLGSSDFASCLTSTTTLGQADIPHDPVFTVTYGPGEAIGTVACAELLQIPVTVAGDGFSLTVRVVRRS